MNDSTSPLHPPESAGGSLPSKRQEMSIDGEKTPHRFNASINRQGKIYLVGGEGGHESHHPSSPLFSDVQHAAKFLHRVLSGDPTLYSCKGVHAGDSGGKYELCELVVA